MPCSGVVPILTYVPNRTLELDSPHEAPRKHPAMPTSCTHAGHKQRNANFQKRPTSSENTIHYFLFVVLTSGKSPIVHAFYNFCIMHVWTLFVLLLTSCEGGWASPLQKRYFDFDGNGLADRCYQICELAIRCLLEDGTWTTIPSSQQLHSATSTGPLPFIDAAEQTQAILDSATTSSVVEVLESTTTSASSMTASTTVSSSTASSSTASSSTASSSTASSSTASSSAASSSFLTTVTTTPSSSLTSSTAAFSTSMIMSVTSESSSSAAGSAALIVQRTSGKSSPSTKASTTSAHSLLPTGKLPSPSQFKADKGDKWALDYMGDLKFTDVLQKRGLRGDNCRTGKVGHKVIWNCGDMMCGDDLALCGFSMSPAFYGTEDVMLVNTTGITNVAENNFVQPWSGDKNLSAPWKNWGMYTSNVAPINSTHGVVYGWEHWRNGPGAGSLNRGNSVSAVTLGDDRPVATRIGPLLTGPAAIQIGLLAILRVDDYIYVYSGGGPSHTTVGRVNASDDVFDADKYEFLKFGTNDTWISGIPSNATKDIGAMIEDDEEADLCGVWGSVVYNNYLNKYLMLCGHYSETVDMYTSDTPWGPWRGSYQIAAGGNFSGSYGMMMHPEYSPSGESDKSWYFSLGPNWAFNMYKVTFDY
ncbi:hypothetical protein LTS15_007791 [Exophiala xenobiotica]|nr:hypothetical protein LTS15_007791 [Exophiala xenobiotica]